ncbi:Phosphatidylinositol-4-phosphate 5-kinase [Phytophthora cinnamomi]|uniref:Phosphatidylinositol-4-phosphate 5-kinase n=1 Tax=Phytophthora cinnamomi TaxID=4785 RepID=UPI00355A0E03|nr:Phosphatidylinositol-4-phosphate 5-kinase [Phytophthora cinnamomi]
MSRTAATKTTGHAPSTLMLERMREAASDLAILATTTQGWRFASERNGAMLYEMAGRNLPQNVATAKKFGRGAGHSSDYYLVRAVTTVHTGVAAMLDLLHSSTTDEYRLVMRQIFNQYFQNGVTIDKLTCTTPPPFAEDPDAGAEGARRSYSEDDAYSVNWLTLKAQSKLGSVENHRDFTLVSYQDVFSRHDSGVLERVGRGTVRARSNTSNFQVQSKLVGVHVLSSVNFQDVPELPIPQCTDRLHFRNSGFVIEETSEPNVLRLSLLLSLLPTKATLKYARKYQRWLQALASCVGNLAQALRPEVTLHCLSKLTWKQSDHCFMCLKMFRTFRRCHHCRFCGEAVCGACSNMVNMSGYEVMDGSGGTLAPGALVSSQRGEPMNADFNQTGDIWHMSSGEGTSPNRNSSGARGFREARGCNACIADLHHGLTASAVVKTRRTSDSSNNSVDNRSNCSVDSPVIPTTTTRLSASNDDEEPISYDSADDVIYERRLGSIATYIPSEGLVEENGPYTVTASSLGLDEPVDEFPASSEELQDKFPAVDEPAPPRFRNVSDPDQLRRMRNVSDPELPQRLKDKHSMVSMSTASSSFSRSSNDRYTNDNVSQYSRGTNFSAMSDGSSACDLSRDPDILALAGLSMKPRPSDDLYEPAPVQRPPMPAKSYDHFSNQVPDEPQKRADAVLRTQKKLSNNEEEDSFNGRTISTPWPGSSSIDGRYRSNTTSTRDDSFMPPQPDMLRPADVLRHRSQTTAALGWNPAATAPLSGSKEAIAKPNNFSSSCIRSSKTVLAGAAADNGAKQATNVATISTAAAKQDQTSSSLGSTKIYITSTARREAVSRPMQQMHRLPASVPEGIATSDPSDRNDMIPLSQAGQGAPNFVVFSDSRRESIFTRSDDGQDMIPLDF